MMTASFDGVCNVQTLRKAHYVRSLTPTLPPRDSDGEGSASDTDESGDACCHITAAVFTQTGMCVLGCEFQRADMGAMVYSLSVYRYESHTLWYLDFAVHRCPGYERLSLALSSRIISFFFQCQWDLSVHTTFAQQHYNHDNGRGRNKLRCGHISRICLSP